MAYAASREIMTPPGGSRIVQKTNREFEREKDTLREQEIRVLPRRFVSLEPEIDLLLCVMRSNCYCPIRYW